MIFFNKAPPLSPLRWTLFGKANQNIEAEAPLTGGYLKQQAHSVLPNHSLVRLHGGSRKDDSRHCG